MSKLMNGVFTALAQLSEANGNVRVFRSELEDGLGSAVASSNAIAYVVGIDSSVRKDGGGCVAEKSDDSLFPISTIMVSRGRNGNDDVFLPEEVWVARHSPEDKPLNLNHDTTHIVGHITGQRAVDTDLQTIKTDTNLPAKFHLVAEGVLYRHHTKKKGEPCW